MDNETRRRSWLWNGMLATSLFVPSALSWTLLALTVVGIVWYEMWLPWCERPRRRSERH